MLKWKVKNCKENACAWFNKISWMKNLWIKESVSKFKTVLSVCQISLKKSFILDMLAENKFSNSRIKQSV